MHAPRLHHAQPTAPPGAQALRCLALAYKPLPDANSGSLSPLDEAGLTFIAMVAMHDPPRRECAAAIQLCRQVCGSRAG
jgi:magnesium-transporting ATPase (P-type)